MRVVGETLDVGVEDGDTDWLKTFVHDVLDNAWSAVGVLEVLVLFLWIAWPMSPPTRPASTLITRP